MPVLITDEIEEFPYNWPYLLVKTSVCQGSRQANFNVVLWGFNIQVPKTAILGERNGFEAHR